MQDNIETCLGETHRLKELQIDWLDDGRDIFELTTTEVDKLETIADSSHGAAGAQARAILSFVYDTTYFYTNCVTVPDTSQKSADAGLNFSNEKYELLIKISPNPASNIININYTINDGSEFAIMQLFNQNGKLLDTVNLDTKKQTVQYDCSGFRSGIYFYTVSSLYKGKSGKIIIVH